MYETFIIFTQSIYWQSGTCIHYSRNNCIFHNAAIYNSSSLCICTTGINLFDLSPTGYSFEYAIKLLDTLGSDGRELYLYRQLPLDFIYPGLFAVSFSLLLYWLLLTTKRRTLNYFTFVISLWRQGCLITSKIFLSLAFLPPIQTFQK